MSGATDRETILATVGLAICGWVITVVIAWFVWQTLNNGRRPDCSGQRSAAPPTSAEPARRPLSTTTRA